MADENEIIRVARIDQSIYLIRGQRVMPDKGLACLYGVGTKVLNQAVKRNKDRFLPDFMFQFTASEYHAVNIEIMEHLSG